MTYVLYGALGTIGVLALMALGFWAGWKARIAWTEHTRQAAVSEATEEERRQLRAEQKAFEGMLNYNPETAYGMNITLEELVGGDT